MGDMADALNDEIELGLLNGDLCPHCGADESGCDCTDENGNFKDGITYNQALKEWFRVK